jgi:hypothetical protein
MPYIIQVINQPTQGDATMRHVTPRYLSDAARHSATRYPLSAGFDYELDTLIHEFAPKIPADILQELKDAQDVGDVTDLLDILFERFEL